MRAVYLNSAHEAALYEEEGGPRPADVIVPVAAAARYFAEQRGWPHRPIASFLSQDTHDVARRASEGAIGVAIERLNDLYHSGRGGLDLSVGEYFRFDLHVILGQIHFTRFVLESIAQAGIQTHKSFLNVRTSGTQVWGVRPHPDALVSEIASRLFPGNTETTKYLAGDESARQSAKRRMRKALSASWVDALYALKWAAADRRVVRPPTKKLLVLGGQFDWQPVLASSAFRERYRPTFFAGTDYPNGHADAASQKAVAAVLESAIAGRPGHAAWNVTDLAALIANTARAFERRGHRLSARVAAADGILTSVFVTPVQAFVGDLASRLDKPVICFQHGEQNLYPEIFDGKLEATYATHYFAYGEGVVEKYQDLINKLRLREVVVVGNTSKKPEYSGGDLILYATGKWFKTARPFVHFPDPDDRLCRAHRNIVEYLESYTARHRSTQCIIKANNTELFGEIPYETSLVIDRDSRFTDLLLRARAVILDTPATTAVEAAFTTVPLFVLSGRTPWYDRPMELLRKRAIVESDPAILTQRLDRFLETGVYDADRSNREFAAAYGGSGTRDHAIATVNQELTRIVG